MARYDFVRNGIGDGAVHHARNARAEGTAALLHGSLEAAGEEDGGGEGGCVGFAAGAEQVGCDGCMTLAPVPGGMQGGVEAEAESERQAAGEAAARAAVDALRRSGHLSEVVGEWNKEARLSPPVAELTGRCSGEHEAALDLLCPERGQHVSIAEWLEAGGALMVRSQPLQQHVLCTNPE